LGKSVRTQNWKKKEQPANRNCRDEKKRENFRFIDLKQIAMGSRRAKLGEK